MSNKTLLILLRKYQYPILFNISIQRCNSERFFMQICISYSGNWKGWPRKRRSLVRYGGSRW